MKPLRFDFSAGVFHLARCLVVLLTLGPSFNVLSGDDWGAYAFVPSTAPAFVLEAVDSGTEEGTIVSINRPARTANQKWMIVPRGDNLYSIKPSYSKTLVMAAANGGTSKGTRIVLETDTGKPWQLWSIRKNEDDSYSLIPRHFSENGLDHLGGRAEVGAQIDLWTDVPGDRHLHWYIKPLAGTLPATSTAESPPSTYVPPETKLELILPGELKQFNYSDSKIFPGTVRNVSVFIPAQYDGSKTACVYVKTDGYSPIEKPLMESLIAAKEMPVTVGVFVTPGELPATVKDTIGRRNRCLEYDGMGDSNVRFLTEELLPYVAKEFQLKLSTRGNDRCIAGGSSGGIAAFNAAWERPEAFSRVYANSGSFVAFRGGHEFPTLVRKFEAKPIRAFLTTGMRDMENCAGDWFLIDLEMDKALKFSGYDYLFRVINGGHVAGYYDNYREAMSYLWQGWPEPVKAGPSAPRVRDVILPGESWKPVSNHQHPIGSPAFNAKGEVYFFDGGKNSIYVIDLEGSIREVVSNADEASGLTVGADGSLYAVSEKTGRIVSYDSTGKPSLVAEGVHGRHLLAVPNGGLYVATPSEVWFVNGGQKTKVDSGLTSATGLALRPDHWLLSVAEGDSKWVNSYQIAADGTLTNKEKFFWLHVADWENDAGAQSVCYAKEGPMLVATRMGVQVCADDGPTRAIIPVPDRSRITGLCFGGRELDVLYAFCNKGIWKRKVRVHGVGAFSPAVRINGTPL